MTRQFLIHTVATCFLVVAACAGVSADTIFYDDFSDGDAEDGMPVTWIPQTQWPANFDASSGDYVLEPTGPAWSGADFGSAVSLVSLVHTDISIRTQVRLFSTPDADPAISIWARTASDPFSGIYITGMNADGDVFVNEIGGPGPIPSAETDLRPLDEDVLLQVDIIGENIKVWAWRPGEPMPQTPWLDFNDSTLTSGMTIAVNAAQQANVTELVTSGAYRFVHVADTHIPEPSTFALAALVFLAVVCPICRKRHTGA